MSASLNYDLSIQLLKEDFPYASDATLREAYSDADCDYQIAVERLASTLAVTNPNTQQRSPRRSSQASSGTLAASSVDARIDPNAPQYQVHPATRYRPNCASHSDYGHHGQGSYESSQASPQEQAEEAYPQYNVHNVYAPQGHVHHHHYHQAFPPPPSDYPAYFPHYQYNTSQPPPHQSPWSDTNAPAPPGGYYTPERVPVDEEPPWDLAGECMMGIKMLREQPGWTRAKDNNYWQVQRQMKRDTDHFRKMMDDEMERMNQRRRN